jgi:4-amino-4-deoxy-L-arabinose transferase-like glycosyltransferase
MWESRTIVLLVSLICAAWIVPGLVGHDPWKPDEAYSFGLVLSYFEGRDWVVPILAQEPFLEKPPIYYLTAALTANAFHAVLPLHDAARLASGLYMALSLLFVGLTGRELFGKNTGWVATLLLVGSIGLVLPGHQLLTDVAQLTGVALGFYGLALGARRPQWGGVCLGTGVGLAFMSKGLLVPGCFATLVVVLPLLSSRWRSRDFARSLFVACLAGLPWLVIWPALLYHDSSRLFAVWFWDNNLGRFLGWNALGPSSGPIDVLVTLAWAALPAWPFALRAVCKESRRDIQLRAELLLPFAGFMVILTVLSASRQGREVYVLPALVPLCLLAVPGTLSVPSRRARVMSTAATALFLVVGLAVWTLWAGLDLSVPSALHERLIRLEPAYHPSLDCAKVVAAIGLLAGWAWVVFRFPGGRAQLVVAWAAGITMAWGLVAALLVDYVDTGNSYRSMVTELRSRLPVDYRCMASHGLGEPQRAMLQYYAGIATYRDERAEWRSRPCNVLLVQGFRSGIYQPDQRWVQIWEGSRPGDRRELYRLYRWSDEVPAQGADQRTKDQPDAAGAFAASASTQGTSALSASVTARSNASAAPSASPFFTGADTAKLRRPSSERLRQSISSQVNSTRTTAGLTATSW